MVFIQARYGHKRIRLLLELECVLQQWIIEWKLSSSQFDRLFVLDLQSAKLKQYPCPSDLDRNGLVYARLLQQYLC